MLVDMVVDSKKERVTVRQPPEAVASYPFDLDLGDFDEERMRWYFEDSPTSASVVPQHLVDRQQLEVRHFGEALYQAIIPGPVAEKVEQALLADPRRTTLQLTAVDPEAERLPWELLWRPQAAEPLAFELRSVQRQAHVEEVRVITGRRDRQPGPMRILLVIPRPSGRDDVPYLTVARALTDAVASFPAGHEVTVLRPPTFEHFHHEIVQARAAGHPYDVVHFDGHGESDAGRGLLVFEDQSDPRSISPLRVPGRHLGKALDDGHVGLLVMNACRSGAAGAVRGPEGQVSTFRSLAHEIAQRGGTSVVAMRYDTYVATAAAFVSGFYSAILTGHPFADAVRHGRFRIGRSGRSTIVRHGAIVPAVSAWAVPTLHVAANAGAAIEDGGEGAESFPLAPAETIPSGRRRHVGHDGVLLTLDRALQRSAVTWLHGLAGSGKTSLSIELADWLQRTGSGLRQAHFSVVATSDGLDRALEEMLSVAGPSDAAAPGQGGLAGGTIPRRLWVVELPRGAAFTPLAAWKRALRLAVQSGAAVLLISRHADHGALGGDAELVHMTNLSNDESFRLAEAECAESAVAPEVWGPIVAFARGNPCTLLLMLELARARAVRSDSEVQEMLRALSAVSSPDDFASVIDDRFAQRAAAPFELREGRGSSAFNAVLAVLPLYGGATTPLDVAGLWHVGGLRLRSGLLPEIEVVAQVFQAMVQTGLVTRVSEAVYAVHPLVPVVARPMLEDGLVGIVAPDQGRAGLLRAFVNSQQQIGYHYLSLSELSGEEIPWAMLISNVIDAVRVSVAMSMWDATSPLLQILRFATSNGILEHQDRSFLDRHASALVNDPNIDDRKRIAMLDILADVAEGDGDLDECLAAAEDALERRKHLAKSALEKVPEQWREADRDSLRSLAVGYNLVGRVKARYVSVGPDGLPVSLGGAEELEAATSLAHRIRDAHLEARVRLNVAVAGWFLDEPDLPVMEAELTAGLDLVRGVDPPLSGRLNAELGMVRLALARRSPDRSEQLRCRRP